MLCTAHILATTMAWLKRASPLCHLTSISVANLYGTATVVLKHCTHTMLLILLYAVSQGTNSWNYCLKVCYSARWHTDGILANATKLLPAVKISLRAPGKENYFLPLVMPNRMAVSDNHFWGYFHCRTIWFLWATAFLTQHQACRLVTVPATSPPVDANVFSVQN